MKVDANAYKTHNPSYESHWLSRLRENFTSGSDGEGLETGQMVPRQPFTRQLFFKALKQNLKVKTFVGTSENALRIQIWTALIALLLIQWMKHQSRSGWCLSLMAASLRWNLFVYRDLREWLKDPVSWDVEPPDIEQLFLNIPGIGQQILERRG
ncbi:MAG: hypothetical protein GY847_00530 [Proteobacteria bacterium]|nr:hypothetical protein [Pseudomonadota bacterium]